NELSQTEIRFSLNGYEIKNINANGKIFSRISYPDVGEFAEVGKPDLPRFTRLIAIPDEGEVSFEIIGLEDEIIPEMNIYPRQSLEDQPQNNEFVINEEYYKNGEIFPLQIVELGTPAILRDYRLVSLTINPFQYDPRTKELRIIQNIDVKVNTSGTGGENIRSGDSKISRFFEALYESVIMNYESIIDRDDEYQDPSYLFIYPNNEDVEGDLQMLADWKHQKGFEVTAVSTAITGSDLASIKNYIQNAYDNWPNPPEFVCLVADGNGTFIIPSGYLNGGPGDQEYARLDGNDILADVFMGRLAYSTIDQFRTIIAKILNYERQPYMGSTNWYTDVLLVGDPSSSGQSTIIISKYIKELITDYDNSFTFDEVYSYPFVSSIESSLNSGVCLFNYRGYLGMSGWGNSNTGDLNNGYMLPFVMMLTCSTGDFTSGECRSEYFLKAGSITTPKGAIGAVGTATINTHSCFNNCVSAGTFHGIFGDGIYQMGSALNMGKLSLYINYPNNPDNKVFKFSYWNNLMGDPGLELWTGVPQPLNVTYDSQVALGTNYLGVTVENSLSEPVQGAWVTALMGNDDIFATGFTNENGEIFLPIQASVTGTADLTVTCHNYIPHLGSFTVAQDDVFLNVYDLIIDDDNSGSSSGNNDGNINPGEDIELKVSLKNYGTQTAYSVTSELSSNNPFITVTDDYENWSNISSGTSSFCNDDFDFTVSEYVLGGTELDFDINIQGAGREQWLDKIYLTVDGPNLIINNIQIVDGNNGILDPGETAEIVLTIENIGSVQASSIEGIFRCSDRRITLLDSTGYFGTILPGNVADNSSNTFEVTADDQIIPGSQLNCTL
ncbi:MAG: hypothetical protein KAT74_02155, partial [Candidatus Cloacimonetes bacterium]|nr:hypothetical protein [Candidatus Cloacimonadota bacterium]